MPGIGISAADRVALGENSLMLVGGNEGGITSGILVRFITGIVNPTASPQDATDNMSGGFTEESRGPRSLMLSADCYWRASDNPFANQPAFEEGQFCPRIIVWPDYLNAPNVAFTWTVGKVNGYVVTVNGVGEVRFSLDIKNHGKYYTPTRVNPRGLFSMNFT